MNVQTTKAINEATIHHKSFALLNRAYNAVFQRGKMSIGLVAPIEEYSSSAVPDMKEHIARAKLAEDLGFSSIWLRDVPFNVPSFGDAGQLFDPFVYLGFLAAETNSIALGAASIVLPLRHPAHVAKASASVDMLSNGRLILGVASGDRPQEYPAMNINFENRGEYFQESFEYIRAMQDNHPVIDNVFGKINGNMDMLPKPAARKIPLLVTGGSQQDPEWIAKNGDGWMLYPREPNIQQRIITGWNERVDAAGRAPQPIMQPLYFDLLKSKDAQPQALHLGFRSGTKYLVEYLKQLEEIGVNHVALNLRFNQLNIESTLQNIAENVLPEFEK